ncbi:adrenomedullin 1-like [Scleropages formosus]|uniref:Adrenomedullin 1-like n=1 Tax=Scleropages formosus TaxID=113540 RepID=A0A0P7WR93_SCLFO|nr:ADM [Scleropages formosus]KPP66119.1 adrenomedullin 1-like [Scleropages formosus]
MKLLLQTALCCCLLVVVTPSAGSAKLDSEVKRRLTMWLQSRTRRDLSGVSTGSEGNAAQIVRPEDVRDALNSRSSPDASIRVRRSKCSLGTCTVHDLAHRLHVLNNKFKIGSAPIDKISPLGYGRRRRSLPTRQAAPLTKGLQFQPVWRTGESRVRRLEKLLRRT